MERTKICAIKSCEFHTGTRLPIRMFNIPKNELDFENWKSAIGSNAVDNWKGMICYRHFCESDLNPATKSKPISLKKNSVPKIFDLIDASSDIPNDNKQCHEDHDDHNAAGAISIGTTELPPASSTEIDQIPEWQKGKSISSNRECQPCQYAKIQYDDLRTQYVTEKINQETYIAKLENKIKQMKSTIDIQSKHIKSLDKKMAKTLEAKDSLQNLLQDLKQRNMLNDVAMKTLEKINKDEVLNCLVNGIKPGEKYHADVRKFCLALYYHKPAAYDIVRNQFNNNLPHKRTIKQWLALSDINGEPGLNDDTFNRLKGFVSDLKGESLVCSLIFDEMYIRQQIYWDENKMDYVGFITYGKDTPPKRRKKSEKPPIGPVAKKALNFMLSGINKHFQFPVAYHFVDSLDSIELAALVSEIIVKVSECGVKIANLTFDGDKKNIAMCKVLGANLDVFSSDFRPYIESPFDKSIIYLMLDPSHAEKLMRNMLGNHKVLYDDSNNAIEWKYFVELVELSKNLEMQTHKINRKHVEFDRNKMNVRLACETFSKSVGDSMEILRRENHVKFVNSAATIRFTYIMDTLFNVFNTTNRRNENIYKCALNANNKRVVFQFIEECKEYLKSLKIEITRKVKKREFKIITYVLKSIHNTPVLGFIMNLTNLPQMYAYYVEKNQLMVQINTYTISQDHIEIFHAKIRSRLGHNTNPTVGQYRGAYRLLLCNLEIKAPQSANCIALGPSDSQSEIFKTHSNIYFVSSRRPKLDIMNDETFRKNLGSQQAHILEEFGEAEDLADLDGLEMSNHFIDGVAGASIAYAARIIEKKIETQIFYCDCCKTVFSQNSKLDDRSIYIIDSKRPCADTFYICKIVDRFLKLYKPKHFRLEREGDSAIDANSSNQEKDFRVLFYMIFQEINFNAVFHESDFKDHEEHKFHLIKCIVQEYIRIKTTQIGNQLTLSQYDKILRTKLTRWIHFCGQ